MAEENNNIDDDIFVGRVLSIMAASTSASLEKFSGWLLAGFGGIPNRA